MHVTQNCTITKECMAPRIVPSQKNAWHPELYHHKGMHGTQNCTITKNTWHSICTITKEYMAPRIAITKGSDSDPAT
jgi:hypothetical protein